MELLKQKHIAHEQELREQEQKRRAAELTLHFEQQIKQQQQQLRLQKKAQAEKEKAVEDKTEVGGKRKSSGGASKEHQHLDKKSRDQHLDMKSRDKMPTALDMTKKPRKEPPIDEDDLPLALNLKISKKTVQVSSIHSKTPIPSVTY